MLARWTAGFQPPESISRSAGIASPRLPLPVAPISTPRSERPPTVPVTTLPARTVRPAARAFCMAALSVRGSMMAAMRVPASASARAAS